MPANPAATGGPADRDRPAAVRPAMTARRRPGHIRVKGRPRARRRGPVASSPSRGGGGRRRPRRAGVGRGRQLRHRSQRCGCGAGRGREAPAPPESSGRIRRRSEGPRVGPGSATGPGTGNTGARADWPVAVFSPALSGLDPFLRSTVAISPPSSRPSEPRTWVWTQRRPGPLTNAPPRNAAPTRTTTRTTWRTVAASLPGPMPSSSSTCQTGAGGNNPIGREGMVLDAEYP